MCHGPLVEYTSKEVHNNGNKEDDAKHAPGPDAARFMRLGLGACMLRHDAEDVCALILVHLDEGEPGRWVADNVCITSERDYCRFPPCRFVVCDSIAAPLRVRLVVVVFVTRARV